MKRLPGALKSSRAFFFMMVFICCIFAAAVLKIASSVILPFIFAILLAFLMYPLIKLLDKLRWPRFLSVMTVVVIMIAFFFIFAMILYTSGRMVAEQLPKYAERFNDIYKEIARLFVLPYDEDLSFWENLWSQLGIRNMVQRIAVSVSGISFKFLQNAFLVAIYVAFFLAEASYFKEKLETAFKGQTERINRMGNDLISQVSRYLSAKFFISLFTGLIVTGGYTLVGLEFAIVWGLVQFLLNFIPTIGSIVAGFVTGLFALLQFWPTPLPVILVVIISVGTNFIIGYILDPKIIGDHVGISPLIVLVSLIIWGFIWGFAGMLLAVPMTVIIKIVCENIPIMEPVSILIGSRRSVKAIKKSELVKTEE